MKRATCLLMTLFAVAMMVPAKANAESFDCKPIEVMELGNRIHVRCAQAKTLLPSSGSVDARARGAREIWYLAIDKTDPEKANRFTSLATAALVSGLTFRAVIEYSDAGNTAGCASNDCRTPTAFGLRK